MALEVHRMAAMRGAFTRPELRIKGAQRLDEIFAFEGRGGSGDDSREWRRDEHIWVHWTSFDRIPPQTEIHVIVDRRHQIPVTMKDLKRARIREIEERRGGRAQVSVVIHGTVWTSIVGALVLVLSIGRLKTHHLHTFARK